MMQLKTSWMTGLGTFMLKVSQKALILIIEMSDIYGLGYNHTEREEYTVFWISHKNIFGVTYGVENHSEKNKLIKIDMTESSDSYFTPWQGTLEKGNTFDLHCIKYRSETWWNSTLIIMSVRPNNRPRKTWFWIWLYSWRWRFVQWRWWLIFLYF